MSLFFFASLISLTLQLRTFVTTSRHLPLHFSISPSFVHYKLLLSLLKSTDFITVFSISIPFLFSNFSHRSSLILCSPMKKVIVKLDVQDDKSKQKAMSTVSSLSGVNSISMDMKEKKLTVTGDVDPVVIVSKLRKICHTVIVSVGPEKEEKKPEAKKDEPKKEDPKKAAEEKKKEEQRIAEYIKAMEAYRKLYPPMCYPPRTISIEEDPNGCVIC